MIFDNIWMHKPTVSYIIYYILVTNWPPFSTRNGPTRQMIQKKASARHGRNLFPLFLGGTWSEKESIETYWTTGFIRFHVFVGKHKYSIAERHEKTGFWWWKYRPRMTILKIWFLEQLPMRLTNWGTLAVVVKSHGVPQLCKYPFDSCCFVFMLCVLKLDSWCMLNAATSTQISFWMYHG